MLQEPSKNDPAPLPVPTNSTPISPVPSADKKRPLPPVTGLMPPQLGEAVIREVRPGVMDASPALARLAEGMMRSIILAPVGWLLLGPLFLRKLVPYFPKRYTLTNRELKIQRGLKPHPVQTIPLSEIDEVRFDPNSFNSFYRTGTLEIVSRGEVRMRLEGVPAPEAFRLAIINACGAWVPGKSKTFQPFIPASTK